MLKLIVGRSNELPNYYDIYKKAFIRCLENEIEEKKAIKDIDLNARKTLVHYGTKMVKLFDSDNANYEQLMQQSELINFIKVTMASFTPSEFENVFPVEKKYNGEEYGWKDYFYTKNMMRELGENTPIHGNINDFLWDYQNVDVSFFMVETMSLISTFRRLEGKKGLMEEFLDDKDIPYYTMHTDDKGKKYFENSQTGEVTKVRKAIPRYLHVVK